jgi:RNA 2',3'-cyclic 3'-phosphodiesterase
MSSRLFLAVVPDARSAARIYRVAKVVKRAHCFDGDLIETNCLHVTLFFLDGGSDAREHIVRIACKAAQEVRLPPFEVSFDRIVSFHGSPGHHPFVLLGGDGLRRLKLLRQALGVQLARNGLKHLAKRDFNPHVTLLYAEREVEERPIEPICWTVDAFVLVHSMHGHVHLARWPLRVE